MNKTKEIIYYVVGLAVMTLGIALIVNGKIGASPWDSVSFGLAKDTGMSPGTWTFLSGIGLVVSIDLYSKQRIQIMPILVGLLTGVFINFWIGIIPASESINIVMSAIGLICMGLGIALYTLTSFPVNPIDHFMTELYAYKKISIAKAKAITDGIGLVVGLLVGGPIGIGTVIIYISLPILIAGFRKIL